MKNFLRMQIIFTCLFSILASSCYASNNNITSPEAPKRTIIQNYKDMVLAFCIADAYHDDKLAAIDAGSSVSALEEWTYYDLEESTKAIQNLVDTYLSRNYFNPLVEAEIKGIKFDFLKCLDLYHSKDLNKLAKRMIEYPHETYKSSLHNYYRDLNRNK
ncbi:type VI secretion system amidase immunity protein Tai4 [Snodgrassella communis]|uniref:type VI secretion system amidase immunity protein Tai4 n=1 Tax=Snodgrassella communis TaxID=2946699 RepID=UPI001EF41D19|nr:type VI secretion system amidase immunity protein Tai4 [Snodgrassella communis]